MAHSARVRTIFKLSDPVLRQVNLYAVTATAAGVGLLALAPAAEGQIIYTPAHSLILANSSLSLDLNRDGTPDFVVQNRSTAGSTWISGSVFVTGAGGNKVSVVRGYLLRHPNSALALSAGAVIGPSQGSAFFNGTGAMAAQGFAHPSDFWRYGFWFDNANNRYLGLLFQINGATHYGWARLSVAPRQDGYEFFGVLTGYAYEATANKPIRAGQTKEDGAAEQTPTKPRARLQNPTTAQPVSLGALALGAQGLPLWRKQ